MIYMDLFEFLRLTAVKYGFSSGIFMLTISIYLAKSYTAKSREKNSHVWPDPNCIICVKMTKLMKKIVPVGDIIFFNR